MARKPDGQKGFLGRLLHNEAGNVLFMTAAFLIPLLGLVGGGVDMSRLYLAKTRLQQACDAGALAGRKAMGNNSWTTGTGSTQARSNNIFDGNFSSAGEYGSGVPTRNFTESGGVVTGTVSVDMPMMVIKVLGITNKTLNISCTAKMEIPNTDVMFVLDNTGSMDDCPNGSSTCNGNSSSKIAGLKSAVKCFYEALTQVNTTEPCTYHAPIPPATTGTWDSLSDPSATTYSGTAQIRFGFMPYAVNVNVGKLLPNSYFPDTWNYQSRVATTSSVWTWTAGAETPSSPAYGSWSSVPSAATNASNYSSWNNSSNSVTIGGTNYSKNGNTSSQSNCESPNSNNGAIGYLSNSGTLQTAISSPVAPTYSAANQTINYSQDKDYTMTAYKYVYSSGGGGSCKLKYATYDYTLTRTASTTRPLTWAPYQRITGWTYQQVNNMNISGLKAGGSTWNNSINMPVGQTSISVNLEGATGSSNINIPSDTTVSWSGCVEERATIQNSNSSNAASDWSPFPTAALDMDIDTIPSATAGTQWGPILPNAVWRRYSGSILTQSSTTTGSQASASCPVQAKKLQTWTTPAPFVTYVNSMTTGGYTFHDIGMIWGARFISPTGIFASENAATSSGQPIQRHIVFMTDGDTNACSSEYSSHGIDGIDRRQTTYAPVDRSLPSSSLQCDDSDQARIINARLSALCTQIQNRNITLWVIAFGTDVQSASKTRLQGCATTPNAVGAANTHYFEAADTASLMAAFKKIAAEIAALRLIS